MILGSLCDRQKEQRSLTLNDEERGADLVCPGIEGTVNVKDLLMVIGLVGALTVMVS